jgi:demethylmenaquinone methyltransferase / 2-methoxy-6-polyprenyl-1,4-benzoquinol methylase
VQIIKLCSDSFDVDSGAQPLAQRIFEGLSPSYDRTLSLVTLMQDSYWKSWLLTRARVVKGSRILDIGCGTGVLEERIDGGVEVVGVDITEEMVRLALSKGISSLRSLNLADGEHLPFRERSFDCVVSCYVVKYCNPVQFVKEAARVLRPGGALVLYDFSPPKGPFAPFHAFYVYGLLKIVGRAMEPVDPDEAFTYLALPEVIRSRIWDINFRDLLQLSGFRGVGSRRLTGGVVTGFWATKA